MFCRFGSNNNKTMKKLIARQSASLQTLFWTYVELIGIDHSLIPYRTTEAGEELLSKILVTLASELEVDPQEVQDYAEEVATNINLYRL